ncbi:hypothetical protein [Sharpea azabuensis]|uniref:hypothetical protein n=1 Tax=Sharpea azabuensis TaxID=322505 RepID=UPI00156A0873|nr:hypothetical protein [Sharpea azabuensis]
MRAGKGLSTFTFISQPILKEYADRVNNAGGLYGQNVEGKNIKSNVFVSKKKNIYRELLNKEIERLKYKFKTLPKELKEQWVHKYDSLINGEVESISWKDAFDQNLGIYSIEHPNSFENSYFQVLSLMSFDRISKYADELSTLVKVSKVDTKRFGNNIAS